MLILVSFGIILQKERVHSQKIIYPMAFLSLGIIYCVCYVFLGDTFFLPAIFKPSDIACIIFVGLMEALLMTHLFPANDHYQTLIHLSSLHIGIFDHHGHSYLKNDEGITFAQVQEALISPVDLAHHQRLHANRTRCGYAYFIEDCTILDERRDALIALKGTLEEKNALLEEENRLELARKQVEKQTEIYHHIQEMTAPQIRKINTLLNQEPFDTAAIKQTAILGAYIKRLSYLLLQAASQDMMSSAHLHLSLRESLTAMESYGMLTYLDMMEECSCKSRSLIACYQAFEKIVEAALPNQASIMIHITYHEHLMMRVELSHSAQIADLVHVREDGILYYDWEG